ncbi:MAG: magnesium transporter [Planctomycetia bacterium TMED53]|nr:MAG: magnesium transporter [Planctomycetia bacterium TMED53]
MSQSPQDPVQLAEEIRALLEGSDAELRLREMLHEVRPEDIAIVLDDLSPLQKWKVFSAIGTEAQAEVIDDTDATSQEQIIGHLDSGLLRLILEEMPPDEATDLLNDLPQDRRREVLSGMDPETTVELLRLMQHPPESAGGIMTLDYISTTEDSTARKSLEQLQSQIDAEVVNYVYVIDGNRHLKGVVSIRDLLGSTPEVAIRELMSTEVISVLANEDQEEVANLVRRYGLKAIPVVDYDQHLLGVATIDDIVQVISEEADEDLYRLAGAPESHPSQQKVLKRALVRIPWLLLPVISGFILAWLHPVEEGGSLQQVLQDPANRRLLLAAFIPLVMGLAGGVGMQSATMVVRGMAVGDIGIGRSTLRLFRQEVTIGVMIALTIGVIIGIVLIAFEGYQSGELHLRLPFAVTAGIGTGILLASACGTAIPILCGKMGLDPALVAGPFITSFNDVTAAITFMMVAEAILRSA